MCMNNDNSNTIFFITKETLIQKSHMMLEIAKKEGIQNASVEISESNGFSVGVRKYDVETIEKTREKNALITVYDGYSKGYAETSNFSEFAIRDTVLKAIDIAKYTAEDSYSGLPDIKDLEFSPKHLKLFFQWNLTPEKAIELALKAENSAFNVSSQIKNSDGATLSSSHGQFYMANSKGFEGGYTHSRHGLSVSPIAQFKQQMERDYWYTTDRNPLKLSNPEDVGRYAAERALSRLGSQKISTRNVAVLFDAPLSASLIGSFVQAVSGSSLYKKLSFLSESIGKSVFSNHVQIKEDPFIEGGIGSAPFDDEGVTVKKRTVVEDGVVRGYFLSSYSAKRLQMKTTGNAGGSHNLRMFSSLTLKSDNLDVMLEKLNTGFFVTELMGQGVNGVTGDYSKGASGFWVENGKIIHPVNEVTIAGNLKNIYKNIVAIGADECLRGNKTCGSVLISNMTVAGK